MAITLDELLGRNTKTDSGVDTSRFPSYDDYRSRRESAVAVREREADADLDYRRGSFGTSDYRTPEYDAYEISENNGFVGGSYSRADRIIERGERGIANERARREDFYARSDRGSLYGFTATDNDRLPERELEQKLSYSNEHYRPVLDRAAGEAMTARERAFAPFRTSEEETVKATGKKRAKLNTKGKVILAVYLALIVLVAVLIIVNAGAINKGEAVTPTSEVEYLSVSETVNASAQTGYNFSGIQIDCMYETNL